MINTHPILIHAYSGALGGSERILLDLLTRIEARLVLACPSGQLADIAEAEGLTVIRLKHRKLESRGGLHIIRSAADVAGHGREIRRLAIDIKPSRIISWGMRSALSAQLMARNTGVPIIAEHVDLLPAGLRGRVTRRALLACDRVIALSAAIAHDLDSSGIATGKISVVYPGIEQSRSASPLPSGQPSVLILAAIEPWKAQDLALEAIANTPNVNLVIAGGPLSETGREFEMKLKQRASLPDLIGRVSFPGFIDPEEAIRKATLVLHPSPSEPFGRSVAESLAAGRAVIAADSAGPNEILDSSCGILVTPGDAPALSQAISSLANSPDLLSEMGLAGRRRAASMFNPTEQAFRWQREAALVGESIEDQRDRAAGLDLTIVTVIHNSAPELARLLASVEMHLPSARVIVVDSGSSDGGASLAAVWKGEATVVSLESNLGFGAGCVAGLARAETAVTAFVNPDVEFVDDSIERLTGLLRDPTKPDRILTPMLVHPDGTRQDAVHPVPGSLPELVRAVIPASLLPNSLAAQLEPHRSNHPIRVGWAVGACMLARSGTFRSLGPFDTKIKLYAEDLDLCLTAADRGIETWYHPNCRALHREAHASSKVYDGEPSVLLASRRREVVGRQLGATVQRRDDMIQRVTLISRIGLKTVLRRDRTLERARLQALQTARTSE